jgi:uncharacterized membrane protein
MNPTESSLERFLSRLTAVLSDVPAERRQDILSETRSHLMAMLAARRSDGMPEAEAWADVERAFGEPEMVGREIVMEWKRDPRFETEGTPLSTAEKAKKLNRLFITKAPISIGLLALVSLLQGLGSASYLYYLLGPLVSAWVIWSYRKKGQLITASVILMCVFQLFVCTFGPHNTHLNYFSSEQFCYIAVGLFVAMMVLVKREKKTTQPWRWLPAYKSNPIAAEDEHRLSSLYGGIYGLAMGCVVASWMHWQFLGLGVGVAICAAFVAIIYLFGRWAQRKSV